jgi:GNAT superfamily N-acetyltransferase
MITSIRLWLVIFLSLVIFLAIMLFINAPACPGLDQDGDGVPDFQDNCSEQANSAQADLDGDGLGDACDPCPFTISNDCTCPADSEPFYNPQVIADPPPMTNIARGASYTLSPAPNYNYCTEPGDATQLTDGIYSSGYFWTQPTTVGWVYELPIITIDLGRDQPIKGLAYHTAAGVAGVQWPTEIFIFVAGEDRQFFFAGRLVELSASHGLPEPDIYATHTYWSDALQTHGRYVAVAHLTTPYAFVDEIEVFEGESEWLSRPYQGDPVSDIRGYIQASAVRTGIGRRLIMDIWELARRAKAAGLAEPVHRDIACNLAEAAAGINELPQSAEPDFKAVLPLNPLHENILRVQAKLWQARQIAPTTLWQPPLWGPLDHLVDPPASTPAETKLALNFTMMQHEYRAAAITLSNASLQPQSFEVRLSDLPSGIAGLDIRVQEVAWTDTASGQPVAAALPKAPKDGENYRLDIPAGMSKQLWFTVFSGEVAAGFYGGRLEITNHAEQWSYPFTLDIYPLRFPDTPHLHFGGWDYTNTTIYGVTEANQSLLIDFLQQHFVDSPWGTAATLPYGQYDSQGNMIKTPDTTNFDRWIERWPHANRYHIFAAIGDHLGSFALTSPEFSRAVAAWAKFWAEHAQALGISPERIFLLLLDEPHAAPDDAIILAWAKAIEGSQAGLKIWEDPTYSDLSAANPEMIEACDLICPNRQIMLAAGLAYQAYLAEQLAKGIELAFYSCSGPARLLDPYAYYRLQAWTCWQQGASESHFWAFGDNGNASSWNEYGTINRVAYTPLFLDATSVTPAKQMEAAREGVEDYEYLFMLRDAIAQAEQSGISPEIIEQARTVLTERPDQVLSASYGDNPAFWWSEEIDRGRADQARVEILDLLVSLTTAGQR